jgi:hypothetical protein
MNFPAIIRITYPNRDTRTEYFDDRASYDEYMSRARNSTATRIQVFELNQEFNLQTQWAIQPA